MEPCLPIDLIMNPLHIHRFFRILFVCHRFGLTQYAAQMGLLPGWMRYLSNKRQFDLPLNTRLRLALESLGPIFVKFGQMLSTRRDLVDDALANELAKLQDQVPAVSALVIRQLVEKTYGCSINTLFAEFDDTACASASIAQVHKAKLHNGDCVAVKILRPNIKKTICSDIALLNTAAWLVEKVYKDGPRMRPQQVVDEFAKIISHEQNLLREAGNASLLRRHFVDAKELIVPEVYWDYCKKNIMVMQWMAGLPILPKKQLEAAGVDVSKLAELGVSIFFKQIFRDGFFHADMHPGNMLVTEDGRYIALDFGIVGTLTDENRRYLAENFMGFFKRDYHRIALAHIEAGWAPSDTPIDEFEAAIRTVCEPVFDRPLSQISFGHFLIQVFDLSREFNIAIQPQLVLLQKTLLQVEGLGRQLEPNLDLWKTAKPYLQSWMFEQLGFKSFWQSFQREAPKWGSLLPQLPRLVHEHLSGESINKIHAKIEKQNRKSTTLLKTVVLLLLVMVIIQFAFLAVFIWEQFI